MIGTQAAPRASIRASRVEPAWLEVLAFALLVAFAVASRVVGIAANTDIADEGIRGLQLRMMAAGFQPVSDVYSHEGPLTISIFYPLYRLFGSDLVAARLAVATYAVGTILTLCWLGRRVAGRVAGLAAGTVLALSPLYLEHSRLALVEVAALAPAVLGVALLVQYRLTGRRGWLVASAILLALGGLAKWMTLLVGAAALPLLVAPDPPGGSDAPDPPGSFRRRLADLLLYGAVSLGTIGVVVALAGGSQVVEQLVGYRLGARTVREWNVAENLAMIRAGLGREGPGLVALAVVGALALFRRQPVAAFGMVGWLLGAFAVMLLYTPLWVKHLVYLLPPLALLAGAAVGVAGRAGLALLRRERPSYLGLAAALAVLVHLGTVPAIAEQHDGIVNRREIGDAERFADDPRIVAAATAPSDFIVMDDSYLADMSGRLVPPFLVDLSYTRIRSRVLSSDRVKEETARFDAKVVAIQDDRLGQLPRYVDWVDRNYVLVRSYVRRVPKRFRRVYVHPKADLAAARAALVTALGTPIRAELGPGALLGYALDRTELSRGSTFDLTLHWEALESKPPGHELMLRLRDPNGTMVQEEAWPIGDGDQELRAWEAGQWQVQTLTVQVRTVVPRGTYALTAGLRDDNEQAAPIRSASGVQPTADGTELRLGTLTVR